MYLQNIMSDLSTQIKVQTNQEYKENLINSYVEFLASGIQTKAEFLESMLNNGEYTYEELTFFTRMNNEEYARIITASSIDLISTYEYSKQCVEKSNKKVNTQLVKKTIN